MKHFSDEEKEVIIGLYTQEEDRWSARKIAKLFKVDKSVIQTRLMKWGYHDPKRINNPKSKKQFNTRQKQKIINLYEDEGLGLTEIAKKFKVSIGVIQRALNIWGINTGNRKHYVNDSFFNKIDTEEKAYWLGFISADGNVWLNSGLYVYNLHIELKDVDINHLQKFLDAIESDYKIYRRSKRDTVSITISSKEIVNDLISYGVIPNKSLTLKPYLDIPVHLMAAYWRGFIDGDGWLSVNNRKNLPQIGLCGTFEVCNEFKNYCSRFIDSKANVTGSSKNNHFSYKLSGKYAYRIIRELYENATVYLTRKKEISVDVLTNYKRFDLL